MNILTRIKQLFVVFVVIATAVGLSSCEKYKFNPPSVDPNATWHFQTDIQPIFNGKCSLGSCHGGPVAPNLSEGKSYLALTKGGYVNAPAESSRLYLKMTTDPAHEARSSATDKLKVLYWITQGAVNN